MLPVLRSGLDWFSASYPDGPAAWTWALRAIHTVNMIADDGQELKARNMNGYQGISAGNCFVGSRIDGYYVQLSGKYADIYFDDLYCDDVQTTRIDIQVTAQFDVMDDTIGGVCYDASDMYARSLSEGKRWKVYKYCGSDGGYTCYIGAAGSKHRAAIYNKAVQSGSDEYARSWRFECRFRDELSRYYARSFADSTSAREQRCLAVVAAWLQERGICLVFLNPATSVALGRVGGRPTDVERRLKWLKSQVAPTIRWLQSRTDCDTINKALGLSSQDHSALLQPDRQADEPA